MGTVHSHSNRLDDPIDWIDKHFCLIVDSGNFVQTISGSNTPRVDWDREAQGGVHSTARSSDQHPSPEHVCQGVGVVGASHGLQLTQEKLTAVLAYCQLHLAQNFIIFPTLKSSLNSQNYK